MKIKKRLFSVLMCFAVMMSISFMPISGVPQNVAAYSGNSSISVDNPNPTIKVGEKLTLKVYTDVGADISFDCNNDNVDCEWGDWFGSDDQNSYFYITGLSAGTSVVTVYDDANPNIKATINVTVTAVPNSTISVDNPNPTIKVGEALTLEVYTDKGADIGFKCNNGNVDCEWGDWFGEDGHDSYFYITGVKEGTSVITIYDDADNSVKATINVTVAGKLGNSTISVDKPNPTVKVGETLTLEVYTDMGTDISYDCNNDNVDCEWGDWFGEDDSDSYFYITGVSKGTSVITIYDDADNSVKATINVTVEGDNAESGTISLNKSRTILSLGTSLDLEIADNTTGISNSSLTWKSSNPAVAKVSSGGTVTGVKEGTATITVSTPGGISASCVVNVKDYAYLVGTDWRTIQRTYSAATYNFGSAYAYTDALGSDVVITYVNYKIISNYRQYKIHNLTQGTAADDAVAYYQKIVDRAFGAQKLRAMDAQIEAQEAEIKLIKGEGRAYTLPSFVPAEPAVNSTHAVGGNQYQIISNSPKAVRLIKAKNAKSVTVPATVSIGGATYSVTGIGAKTFKGTKTTTVTIKTKALSKARVKNSLKSSKVKTVKVKVGSKSQNKKYVKKYKKYFTKKNAGKKVTVK